MALSGLGMLITKMDIDPADEPGFNDWYDKEHLAERVGIKGFTEARRYVAVKAEPTYLNLYTTRDFSVLTSPEYRKALDNQTERSVHYINRFRNFGRAIVRVTSSHGQGHGSYLFFIALRPVDDRRTELRQRLGSKLAQLIPEHNIISAHLVESDPELSKPLGAVTPPPGASDWYIMIDGTNLDAVQSHGNTFLKDGSITPTASTLVAAGTYRIMWSLPRNEL